MPDWRNLGPEEFNKAYNEELFRNVPGHKQEAHMVSEIPKQDLLAKLLMMTQSSNDGECLVAIRKANNLMTQAGWTWEMLIRNKIKIVENPFAGLSDPRNKVERHSPPPQKPPPQTQQTPQPRPTPVNSRHLYAFDAYCYSCGLKVAADAGWGFSPSLFNLNAPSGIFAICDICNSTSNLYIRKHQCAPQKPNPSNRPNQYPGFCYCCGAQVSSLSGFIFKPFDFNSSARNTWFTLCTSCNVHGAIINDHPAKHSKVFKPGLVDL